MKNLVDSSGWVEYFTGDANAQFFSQPIQAVKELLVPTICIYEVFKRLLLDVGEESALQAVGVMSLGQVVELNLAIALEAAHISVAEISGSPLISWDKELLQRANPVTPTAWLAVNPNDSLAAAAREPDSMITHLSAKNFKSWHDTGAMRLAPLTALFGPNSSGKTSLLQLLLMLKQTTESPDRAQVLHLGDERTLVELGTFQELVFAHNLQSSLEWSLDWILPETLKVEDPTSPHRILFAANRLGFSASIGWQRNGEQALGRAVVQEMRYRFADSEFGMQLLTAQSPEYELFAINDSFKFERSRGRAWKLPPPAKCYGFPDQVRGYYQNAGFLSDFELQLEELFKRVFYLGPLRDYPKRQYSWAGAQPSDMGQRGEKVVDALLAARETGPQITQGRGRGRRRLTLEERVAKWLKDLHLIENFVVRPITPEGKLFQVWVKRSPQAPEVLITDVGFGVSQILPVITLCYYVPEGSTLLLEQPEIHLHPRVQADLADVFIDVIKTRNIQIVLESHSEHLLRRLQRRVAEEKIYPEQAALYFCTMEQGESRLESLTLNPFGTIENWPEDFFGDEFGEIAAMSEAALTRKKHEAL